MGDLLFPSWMLFAGFFLFLKIYNPTRLYLDNITCLAIAIAMAIFVDVSQFDQLPTFGWVVAVFMFAVFFCALLDQWHGWQCDSAVAAE